MTRLLINKTRILVHHNQVKLFILYLVMLSGGMIQHLRIYGEVMGLLAPFIIISISAIIYIEYYGYIKRKNLSKSERDQQLKYFSLWMGIIFITSLAVENIGVITGAVFGNYAYGPVLHPFIGKVPLAIGFAWINMLVPAMMITSLIIKRPGELYKWLSFAIVGILMVLFDVILEKAAIELNYWYWENGKVPLQNYLTWFILGFIFARIGTYLKINRHGLPHIYQHIYLAQIGYFILVILR